METTSQTLKSLENWTTKALNKVKMLNKSHWLNFFEENDQTYRLKALC